VPWFVFIDDAGVPDFRIIAPGKVVTAVKEKRCWICGQPLGRMLAFVIGPMCAVNRISAEPPSHPLCADFAARACPFLTHPLAKRNERDLPQSDGVKIVSKPPGEMIERNPGVTLVWWTLRYRLFFQPSGPLFRIGTPERTQWFARGREATRDEVMDSISTGLPVLKEMAEAEGQAALSELAEACRRALLLVPAAA